MPRPKWRHETFCPVCLIQLGASHPSRGRRRSRYAAHALSAHPALDDRERALLADRMVEQERAP